MGAPKPDRRVARSPPRTLDYGGTVRTVQAGPATGLIAQVVLLAALAATVGLSVYVAPADGWWVLAIGAARYAFLAAGWLLPWMRADLPPRDWRKTVAATQGIVLAIAAAGVLPPDLIVAALAGALALLGES